MARELLLGVLAVHELVLPQEPAKGESLVADVALVRFLARVDEQVLVETGAQREGPWADGALVLLLRRVAGHVDLQVGLLVEALAADLAGERFHSLVGQLVRLQGGDSGK